MDFSSLKTFLNEIADEKIPGCDLVIKRDHETLLRYSSGVSDYAGNRPVSDRDIYKMYS
jgi:hypothetical protein